MEMHKVRTKWQDEVDMSLCMWYRLDNVHISPKA